MKSEKWNYGLKPGISSLILFLEAYDECSCWVVNYEVCIWLFNLGNKPKTYTLKTNCHQTLLLK